MSFVYSVNAPRTNKAPCLGVVDRHIRCHSVISLLLSRPVLVPVVALLTVLGGGNVMLHNAQTLCVTVQLHCDCKERVELIFWKWAYTSSSRIFLLGTDSCRPSWCCAWCIMCGARIEYIPINPTTMLLMYCDHDVVLAIGLTVQQDLKECFTLTV